MSADAWETCPLCHAVEAVREDYEIYIKDGNSIQIYFKGVCQRCGAKRAFNRSITAVFHY